MLYYLLLVLIGKSPPSWYNLLPNNRQAKNILNVGNLDEINKRLFCLKFGCPFLMPISQSFFGRKFELCRSKFILLTFMNVCHRLQAQNCSTSFIYSKYINDVRLGKWKTNKFSTYFSISVFVVVIDFSSAIKIKGHSQDVVLQLGFNCRLLRLWDKRFNIII